MNLRTLTSAIALTGIVAVTEPTSLPGQNLFSCTSPAGYSGTPQGYTAENIGVSNGLASVRLFFTTTFPDVMTSEEALRWVYERADTHRNHRITQAKCNQYIAKLERELAKGALERIFQSPRQTGPRT